MVNLKANPYYLNDEDIRWVEETIASMTDEEKVGQLFFQLTQSPEEDYIKELMETYHLGGCRYNPMPGEKVLEQNRYIQKYSKIPALIACNPEAGGDGACQDGTYIGSGVKIGATRNVEYAYALGRMANEQSAAIGCNMAFAPVCDIAYNWENTEIINRAFGNDPERVAEMSAAYVDGAHTVEHFACTAKHFPGNGLDFRDAHISNNVNALSLEEWMKSYGKVYKKLFDHGVEAVMGGHIMMPVVEKELDSTFDEEYLMPATLSYGIMTKLLRDILGFNGMVVTDASHMVAMTNRMKRKEMLPRAINAGCDMFLFFNDPKEDFTTMLDAYKNGVISEERMTEALTRILGLKAHLGLHRMNLGLQKKNHGLQKAKFADALAQDDDGMAQDADGMTRDAAGMTQDAAGMKAVLQREEYKKMQQDISRDSITLVKYKDMDVLPMTPERYKRVMIVHVKGAQGPMAEVMKMMGYGGGTSVAQMLKDKLCEKGFETFIYESPLDQMKKKVEAGEKPSMNLYFAGKNAIADFTKDMDIVITLCDVPTGRPAFGMSKGGGEIPWYVFELPVIVVGCGQPTMLADIPMARTYINTYDAKESTLDALVEKLMIGAHAFVGKDPIDSFCGVMDARL